MYNMVQYGTIWLLKYDSGLEAVQVWRLSGNIAVVKVVWQLTLQLQLQLVTGAQHLSVIVVTVVSVKAKGTEMFCCMEHRN